jgi:hypothetical protein
LEDQKKQEAQMTAVDKGAGAAQKAAGALQNAPQLIQQLQAMLGGQGQGQQQQKDPLAGYPQPQNPYGDLGLDPQEMTDAASNAPAVQQPGVAARPAI